MMRKMTQPRVPRNTAGKPKRKAGEYSMDASNTFQAPASPSNPLLEEFYYVDTNTSQPNGHFRHQGITANVVFCDGHVARENPVAGSLDQRLPAANVARLRAEILTLQ